jgi:4-cresol dehydrogenase (hydroxylating)
MRVPSPDLLKTAVESRSDRLTKAETATFETHRAIPMILRPESRAEVQECVRMANREGLALYPVSTGKNWGYGSSVPTADRCALLDLSCMTDIVDFNERLALRPRVPEDHLHSDR